MRMKIGWMNACAWLGLVVMIGACSYEPPTSGPGSGSSSSSGVGGDGGAGASGGSGSSGMGGRGGNGGMGGGIAGAGGQGGMGGSNSGGAGGAGGLIGTGGSASEYLAPDAVVDCGAPNNCKTAGFPACCVSKPDGNVKVCDITGVCLGAVKLDCDDKADCLENTVCCLADGDSTCVKSCSERILCKSVADCPTGHDCNTMEGPFKFCGPA